LCPLAVPLHGGYHLKAEARIPCQLLRRHRRAVSAGLPRESKPYGFQFPAFPKEHRLLASSPQKFDHDFRGVFALMDEFDGLQIICFSANSLAHRTIASVARPFLECRIYFFIGHFSDLLVDLVAHT
jgi:hypothetical protein